MTRTRDHKGRFLTEQQPLYKDCVICATSFYCRSLFKYETSKYCSRACLGKSNARKKAGKKPYAMTDATRRRISKAKTGVSVWGGKRVGMDWVKGARNVNWKGGITPLNEKIRKTVEYEDWRKAVFERDSYTCQSCGEKGSILHADHIKPFAYFEELRFDLDNGRTLCIDCHRNTETWGFKGIKLYERRRFLRAA